MEWALYLYSQLHSMFFLPPYRYQYSNRGFKLEKMGWADMGQSKNWGCEEHAHSWVLGLAQCLAAEWACAGEWTTQSVPWKQRWPGRWLFFPSPFDIPKSPSALYERSSWDPTFALIYEHPKGTACNTDNLLQQKQHPGLQIQLCLP